MARIYISQALRKRIIELSHNRCEYCQSMADYSNQPFAIEHIIPLAKGGETILINLAYAYDGCNGHKYDKTSGVDPYHQTEGRLFHPRSDLWEDHFEWSEDYAQVIGRTPIGRATVATLKLNRSGLVNARHVFILVGLHPPINP